MPEETRQAIENALQTLLATVAANPVLKPMTTDEYLVVNIDWSIETRTDIRRGISVRVQFGDEQRLVIEAT